MSSIIDYVGAEMERFGTKSFRDVDSLVLSQFSYVYFDRVVPGVKTPGKGLRIGNLLKPDPGVRIKDLLKAELFDTIFHNVRDGESNRRLLFALAASPRFRDIRMNYYVNKIDYKIEEQFSAVTYQLDDGTAYVAYRGTDATFVGWKEDFNMAFLSPVPSQVEGVRYLNLVASLLPGGLRVGGHSKGGNIAVYSAAKCDRAAQDRILGVFSHDGPGFNTGFLECSEYSRIKDRIHKTLPQSSIVGMLLDDREDYSVVDSSRIGLMQHDPFSWIVDGDSFHLEEKITGGAEFMHRTLNQWLDAMAEDKRGLFVDTLFQILGASDADTFSEFSEDWRKSAGAMLEAFKNIDPETRKGISKTLNELVRYSFKNLHRSDERSV